MRLETQNKQGVAMMLDANVHERGRIEYHTPAPGSYLSENDLLGIPIPNPFFTWVYIGYTLGIHQLQTSISQATGIFEPPDLFQWILH